MPTPTSRLLTTSALACFVSTYFVASAVEAQSGTVHITAPTKITFGSSDQWKLLKKTVKAKNYAAVLITWKIEAIPNRRSAMIWDSTSQTLYRVHSDRAGAWEQWSKVSRSAILSSGDEIPASLPYLEGRGPMILGKTAKSLFQKSGL